MAGPSSHFHCCVPQCSSDSRYEANISFHAFPKAEERRGKLILAIRREEGPLFKISKSTVVCGKHFRREEKRKTICKTLLRPGVVPSLFAWHNPPPQRKPPMRRSRLQSRKILADVLIDRGAHHKKEEEWCELNNKNVELKE
ncbi:THAP domain-containing protein 6-like [Haliotis rufescens]|uniref:THAP domain-containing protein 6-like n=1 Tax=Haliotis rufescens TaxID=6454 RepID=UPI00201F22C0|nr:THAP domain-containing protein 6-like [Haliotis rufescens]